MKALQQISFFLFLVPAFLFPFQRAEINFDSEWKFYKSNVANAQTAVFDDSQWESITLPHTWNNLDGQDGGGDYYRGPAWYRKHFSIPKEYKEKKIFIQFGAANMVAEVFLNEKLIGRHEGGYAAFTFDITGFVRFDKENIIAVKVDNSEKFNFAPLRGDFTMCGGIHRSVQLTVTDKLHISPLDFGSSGVYIQQTNVGDASADIRISTKVKNDNVAAKKIIVESVITDREGNEIEKLSSESTLKGNQAQDIVQRTSLKYPHLWNGRNDPYLYTVAVSIREKGGTLDAVTQPLGIRYFSVDPDKGFFLNGRPYDLHGFNRHEDKKDKGRAMSDSDREDDMRFIMDIGSTVVRLAHYQHADKMYELCDRHGIIVWAEIPFVDFSSLEKKFGENLKQQLRELIRQNYNHPSICFWGLFNEVYIRKEADPVPLIHELNSIAKREDPTRYTVGAANIDSTTVAIPDLIGFNKYYGWYEGEASGFGKNFDALHEKHKEKKIGVSEYGAGGSIFHHQEKIEKTIHNAMWHPEEYQTYFHEKVWKQLKTRPYLWIKTIWNGFDFSADWRREGFSAGVNDKGLITHDHAVKKDSYYWYKVNWNDEPMVFITGKYFAKRDTSVITVKVYSNANDVELFVNSVSLGKKASDDHIFKWENVSLQPRHANTIKAVAVVNGKKITDQCWFYAP